MNLLNDFNHTRPTEPGRREVLLKELFAEIGDGCCIEPPLHANWGGHHVHMGKNVYANFNLTLVDDTHIYIGDYTMIAPNVVIATGGHPLLPELREKGYQYNASVHIGRNCWLGAGVIIVPGITIGDNVVRRIAGSTHLYTILLRQCQERASRKQAGSSLTDKMKIRGEKAVPSDIRLCLISYHRITYIDM